MKTTVKRLSSLVLVLAMALSIATGCGGGGSAGTTNPGTTNPGTTTPSGETITLKLGHTLAVTGHYEAGVQEFARLVKERSGGTIIIESYPGAVLGGERDMIEAMQLGTLDMALSSSAPIGGFLPEMMVYDLPFIFRDAEHAWRVADGELGDKILANLENIKLKGLAYWSNSFRMLFTRDPVRTVDDLKGMKIRVMENSVHMRSFEALGAIPTPMAYGELFTALQQKTIDGAENAVVVVATDKFNEVCGNLSLTAHFFGIVPLLMSKSVYDKLTPDQQKIIEECAVEAGNWQRQYTADTEEQYLKELADAGMEIIEVDRDTFRVKCEPIYSEFYDSIPKEYIDTVLNS